jgi:hypothetical protein
MSSANPGELSWADEGPPEPPFGEDITNPDSRTMPPEFHGTWVRDPGDCHASRSATRTVISGDRIVTAAGAEHVVAVRFIEAGTVPDVARPVAVVTLPAEADGQRRYSLFYFGLSADGDALIDLESMDWVLRRCPATAS